MTETAIHEPRSSSRWRRLLASLAVAAAVAVAGNSIVAAPAPAEAAGMRSVADIASEARARIGVKLAGSPWQAYFGGLSTDWCAMFASWLIRDQSGPKSASSTALYDYYAARGMVGTTPRAGALIFYTEGSRYSIYHVGFVESVNGGVAQTIEGNTPGSLHFSQTYVKSYPRPWSTSVLYAYPSYSTNSTPPPLTTPTAASKFILATPDFNGDGKSDVFRVRTNGDLVLYTGDGASGWSNTGAKIGSGWAGFAQVVAPGDFSGDGKADLIGILPDGTMKLYTGNGAGAWLNAAGTQIGTGFLHPTVFGAGDVNGDGKQDLIAVAAGGNMYLYAGNGAGGWVTGHGELIGSGWSRYQTALGPRDFNGDGFTDVIGSQPSGALTLFTGNGAGGWINGSGVGIGNGFNRFSELTSAGDFSGDGKADLIGVQPDGAMYLYRGNGSGGWITDNGELIGKGW